MELSFDSSSGGRVTRSQRKRLGSVEPDVSSRPSTPLMQKLNAITEVSSGSGSLRPTRRISEVESNFGTPTKSLLSNLNNTANMESPCRRSARRRSLSISTDDKQTNNKSAIVRQPLFEPLIEEKDTAVKTPNRRVTRSSSISPSIAELSTTSKRDRKSISKTKEISKESVEVTEGENLNKKKIKNNADQNEINNDVKQRRVIVAQVIELESIKEIEKAEIEQSSEDATSMIQENSPENLKSVVFNSTYVDDGDKTVYPKTPFNMKKKNVGKNQDMSKDSASSFSELFGDVDEDKSLLKNTDIVSGENLLKLSSTPKISNQQLIIKLQKLDKCYDITKLYTEDNKKIKIPKQNMSIEDKKLNKSNTTEEDVEGTSKTIIGPKTLNNANSSKQDSFIKSRSERKLSNASKRNIMCESSNFKCRESSSSEIEFDSSYKRKTENKRSSITTVYVDDDSDDMFSNVKRESLKISSPNFKNSKNNVTMKCGSLSKKELRLNKTIPGEMEVDDDKKISKKLKPIRHSTSSLDAPKNSNQISAQQFINKFMNAISNSADESEFEQNKHEKKSKHILNESVTDNRSDALPDKTNKLKYLSKSMNFEKKDSNQNKRTRASIATISLIGSDGDVCPDVNELILTTDDEKTGTEKRNEEEKTVVLKTDEKLLNNNKEMQYADNVSVKANPLIEPLQNAKDNVEEEANKISPCHTLSANTFRGNTNAKIDNIQSVELNTDGDVYFEHNMTSIKKRRKLNKRKTLQSDEEDEIIMERNDDEVEEELDIKEKPYVKHSLINSSVFEIDEYSSGDSLDSSEREELEENEIPVDAESLGSEDTEDSNTESEKDDDSFIESDKELDLLDYDDIDENITSHTKKKRRSMVIFSSDLSDDETVGKIIDFTDGNVSDSAKKYLKKEGENQVNKNTVEGKESDIEKANVTSGMNDDKNNEVYGGDFKSEKGNEEDVDVNNVSEERNEICETRKSLDKKKANLEKGLETTIKISNENCESIEHKEIEEQNKSFTKSSKRRENIINLQEKDEMECLNKSLKKSPKKRESIVLRFNDSEDEENINDMDELSLSNEINESLKVIPCTLQENEGSETKMIESETDNSISKDKAQKKNITEKKKILNENNLDEGIEGNEMELELSITKKSPKKRKSFVRHTNDSEDEENDNGIVTSKDIEELSMAKEINESLKVLPCNLQDKEGSETKMIESEEDFSMSKDKDLNGSAMEKSTEKKKEINENKLDEEIEFSILQKRRNKSFMENEILKEQKMNEVEEENKVVVDKDLLRNNKRKRISESDHFNTSITNEELSHKHKKSKLSQFDNDNVETVDLAEIIHENNVSNNKSLNDSKIKRQRIQKRCEEILEAANRCKLEAKLATKKVI